MPASRAGSAAASQSCTTRDRNALPAGAASVTSRPPVSPYQPIAEAMMNAFGRGSRRGERGGEGRGGEHPAGPDLRLVAGGPAVVAHPGAGQVHDGVDAGQRRVAGVGGARVPADLLTALSLAAGSPPARGGRLTRRTTWWPSARRLAVSAVPIRPDEPVTATFIGARV